MSGFTRRAFFSLVASVGLATVALGGPAAAADRGTKDEAKALVAKAVDALSGDRDGALEQLSNTSGPFVDRDLYVIVMDETGTIKAHGANNKLIGKNLSKAKDPDGVQFVSEFQKSVASAPDGGWVNFKFTHPKTKKIENKVMWIVGFNGWMVMAGAYPDA